MPTAPSICLYQTDQPDFSGDELENEIALPLLILYCSTKEVLWRLQEEIQSSVDKLCNLQHLCNILKKKERKRKMGKQTSCAEKNRQWRSFKMSQNFLLHFFSSSSSLCRADSTRFSFRTFFSLQPMNTHIKYEASGVSGSIYSNSNRTAASSKINRNKTRIRIRTINIDTIVTYLLHHRI